MTDLLHRLSRLDGTAATSESDVAGDLTRAHTALARRRRTRAAVAGAGLTLGVGAAFGVVAVIGNDEGAAPADIGASHAPRHAQASLRLVEYTGAQPEGFELAKVPEGYVVQGSDAFVLTLAKPGDHSHYLAFDHKVVVMLASQDAPQRLGEGRDVTVNGTPAVLQGGPGETRNLKYFQDDHLVDIQVWEDIALTDDQLIELAESITVTADVQAGVG
jgi:hypothetical protein